MRKKSATVIIALLLISLIALPALAFEPGEATVKADWLNFRDAPGMDGNVIGLAPEGTVVEILEDLGDWCLVRWNGTEGYMSARYLVQSLPEENGEPQPEAPLSAEEPDPEAEEPAPEAEAPDLEAEEPAPSPEEADAGTRVGVLTGDGVRFRAGPGLDQDVYGHFYVGNRVTVLEKEGDWYKVESGGRIGYVYAQYLQILEKSEPPEAGDFAEAVIATAKENLDIRYTYGGTSPGTGFDCSGFVYYCFSQNGMLLERTASMQYTMGVYVDKSELIPGDLVFFVSPGTWSIGHVGIYIGDDEFIHASSGQAKIMVSGLSESYWSSYYYGARRIGD